MSQLHLVEQSIQQLELAKSDLLRQLEHVEQRLVSEQAKYAHLRNQALAIHILPNELLALVFADAHALLRSGRSAKADLDALRFLVETSRVCVRWRQIILHTPLLWNTIAMTITPGFKTIIPAQEYLLAHLTRSNDAYLDMVFYAETGDPADLDLFFTTIGQHAKRWRRVSIEMRLADIQVVRSHLSNLCCALLKHFSINIADSPNGRSTLSPRTQYPDIHPQIFLQGAPNLDTLRLTNEAIGNLHPQSTLLHTLHLVGWDNGFFRWAQFKSLLESLPQLRNLSLHELCVRFDIRDPLNQPASIQIPELRCLRLHKPFTPVDRILPLLTAPKLERVSLHEMENFDCCTIPTVTHLLVDNCPFQDHHAERLVAAFPNVEHISVDASAYALYDPGFMATAAGNPEQYPWPLLKSLTMRQMSTTDVATFALMVLKRKVDNHPIATINVDKRSRNVFRLKGKLDLLTENASVCTVEGQELWPPGRMYNDPHDLV